MGGAPRRSTHGARGRLRIQRIETRAPDSQNVISERGKRARRQGCASEIHGGGASCTRSVHVFSIASLIALHYSFGAVICCVGIVSSVWCVEGFLFRFFPPHLFSPVASLTRNPPVREGGLLGPISTASVRRSGTLRSFSPDGQPEGGFGHHRVGLRVTIPFHVRRLLRCVLVAPS